MTIDISTASATTARSVRPVTPMMLPNIEPAPITTGLPEFCLVDPKILMVDETYQRNLSEKSVRLIRRIVADWDWRAWRSPTHDKDQAVLHQPRAGGRS